MINSKDFFGRFFLIFVSIVSLVFCDDLEQKSNKKPVSLETQRAILKEKKMECMLRIYEEIQLLSNTSVSRVDEPENDIEDDGDLASFFRHKKNSSTIDEGHSFPKKIREDNGGSGSKQKRKDSSLSDTLEEEDDDDEVFYRLFNLTAKGNENRNVNSTDELLRREENFDANDTEELFCSTTFDDVYCWPRTPASTLVSIPCPSYVKGFSSEGKATKFCTSAGVWFTLQGTNSSWTNYTDCQVVIEDFLRWTPRIRSMATAGYAVSLATLLVALMVLISFKNLHCPRNSLHMHLFASFASRAACAICRNQFVSDHPHLSSEVLYKCRAFTCVWQYCILANYFWILMEGLYLHNLIFLSIFNDNSSITSYVLRGWGCPFILVALWSVARATQDNFYCWTTNNNAIIFWVFIRGPISIIILISFGLFMKITRELFLKLRSRSTFGGGRRNTYKQWARSTLVLVPLFGVHYAALLGFGYFMDKNPTIELVWLFTDQFFASFQGFFVATLYCLLNGEVRHEIRKVWYKWKRSSLCDRVDVDSFHHLRSTKMSKRDSRRSLSSNAKPKVALVSSFEMHTHQNELKDSCSDLERFHRVNNGEFQPLNNGTTVNHQNESQSTKSLITPNIPNNGKERSFSVETCVLHVSSSTDLRNNCLSLLTGNSPTNETCSSNSCKDYEEFPLKEMKSHVFLDKKFNSNSVDNLCHSYATSKTRQNHSDETKQYENNNNNNNSSLKNNFKDSRMSI